MLWFLGQKIYKLYANEHFQHFKREENSKPHIVFLGIREDGCALILSSGLPSQMIKGIKNTYKKGKKCQKPYKFLSKSVLYEENTFFSSLWFTNILNVEY